jgi:hypothetical protein
LLVRRGLALAGQAGTPCSQPLRRP